MLNLAHAPTASDATSNAMKAGTRSRVISPINPITTSSTHRSNGPGERAAISVEEWVLIALANRNPGPAQKKSKPAWNQNRVVLGATGKWRSATVAAASLAAVESVHPAAWTNRSRFDDSQNMRRA